MKKNILLFSTVLLMSCSSSEIVECLDCERAPTSILIPHTYNTIQEDYILEKELTANTEKKTRKVSTPKIEQQETEPQAQKVAEPNKTSSPQNTIPEQLHSLAIAAKQKWGEDAYIQSSKHRYVKYFDDYKTRSEIQFDLGKIIISTVESSKTSQSLKDAIVQTVLMPQNPTKIDLFGAEDIALSAPNDRLLFLGQILDQDAKSIEWQWRADRFANYLIKNNLQQKNSSKGTVYFIEIALEKNHLSLREKIYADTIQSAANKYQISEDLITAVIKTESSFNPFSVTSTGALGIMQIAPTTAGKDVFKHIKKSDQSPSIAYLLDSKNSIDVGSAYLSMLYNRYLNELTNPTSRYFAMISAYNSGAGNVFSTFDVDPKKAIEKINQSKPRQVYELLVTQHPKKEARIYLESVLKAQKNFVLSDV